MIRAVCKNYFFIFYFLVAVMCPVFFMTGCSPRVVTVTEIRDSVRTEIRERLVHDSVMVKIPIEVEKNVTLDDSSHVETTFAESDAVVRDGKLFHSIRNKVQEWKTSVDVPVADTTRYESHSKEEQKVRTVTVEKELSWWQKTQMKGFWLLLFIVVAYVAYKYRRMI